MKIHKIIHRERDYQTEHKLKCYVLAMSPTKVSVRVAGDHLQMQSVTDNHLWTSTESRSLPKDIVKLACDELREDENSRTQSLLAFRQWISKNSDVQNVNTGMIFFFIINYNVLFIL